MTSTMVNAVPHHTPLATQFFMAIKRHDDAEEAGDEAAMSLHHEEINAIEAAAIERPAIGMAPDIAHRICVARGMLNDVYDRYARDGDVEAVIVDIEKVLDGALDGLCKMTSLDPRIWRLDYYYPALPMEHAAEAA